MIGSCSFIIQFETVSHLSHNEAEVCVLHDYVFVSIIKIAQTDGETVQWDENSTAGISGCIFYAKSLC
jgi:hypothetical protein